MPHELTNIPEVDHVQIRSKLNYYANTELAEDEIDWSWAQQYAASEYRMVPHGHTEAEIDKWCASSSFAASLLAEDDLNPTLRQAILALG
jgi:hypothetical protein